MVGTLLLTIETALFVVLTCNTDSREDKLDTQEAAPDQASPKGADMQELDNSLTLMYLLVEAGRAQVKGGKATQIRDALSWSSQSPT